MANGNGFRVILFEWVRIIAAITVILAAAWAGIALPHVEKLVDKRAAEEAKTVKVEAKDERAALENRLDNRLNRIEDKLDRLLLQERK